MANGQMNLEEFGISTSTEKSNSNSVKNLVKNYRKINDAIAAISDDADQEEKELRDIKQEIAEKCAKLLSRQKEIKQNRKKRDEERMLLLGERRAYRQQLKQLGFEMKDSDLSAIPQTASRRLELSSEVKR